MARISPEQTRGKGAHRVRTLGLSQHGKQAIRFALIFCSLVAVFTACNVVRYQRGHIEKGLRHSGLEEVTAELNDATLHYWMGGHGKAVLLLHGFGASAIWQWYEQVDALAGRYRVIVPDLLWFGDSTSEVEDFSLDHQVRTVVSLLDRLGEDRVHLVGISYGGLVAYQLASVYPDRVDRVVIADSPGRVYSMTDLNGLLSRFGVEDIAELLIPDTREDVERLMEIAYYNPPYTPGFARDDVLEELYGKNREEQAELLRAVVKDMEKIRATPDRYRAETLLVWGRHDPVFPLEIGERLATYLGDRSRLAVIDNARHAPNVEHPQLFNELLLEFFIE